MNKVIVLFLARLALLFWAINAAYILFTSCYDDGLTVLRVFNFGLPTILVLFMFFGAFNEDQIPCN